MRGSPAWIGSWTGASDNPSVVSAVSARTRVSCTASVRGAGGRTSHNPPVVGSSPTRPSTSKGPHAETPQPRHAPAVRAQFVVIDALVAVSGYGRQHPGLAGVQQAVALQREQQPEGGAYERGGDDEQDSDGDQGGIRGPRVAQDHSGSMCSTRAGHQRATPIHDHPAARAPSAAEGVPRGPVLAVSPNVICRRPSTRRLRLASLVPHRIGGRLTICGLAAAGPEPM
jgi:hypothetical protein